MIKLTPRLSAVAGFVSNGAVIADIGTDHAYIPAYLIETGVIAKAFACDIKEGPLKNAEKTVFHHKISGVTFVLCDGLSALKAESIDEIIIAGMGGEMISYILQSSPWCKNRKYSFVLQPMSKIDYLRKYLYREGFRIQKETLAAEDEKIYTVMKVVYTGEAIEITESFALMGMAVDHPLFKIKQKQELERLNKIYLSLNNKQGAQQTQQNILRLMKEIEVYSC